MSKKVPKKTSLEQFVSRAFFSPREFRAYFFFKLRFSFAAFVIAALVLIPLLRLVDSSFFRARVAHAVVPAGVIVAWPSTDASIPSGWTRVTGLDSYYLEGTTSDPSGSAGGSSTHTHSSPTHTHSTSHTHTGTITATDVSVSTGGGTGGVAGAFHSHTITTGSGGGTNSVTSASIGTASNDPPYTEVIWIESDGTTDIPEGAWAIFESDTLPSSWSRVSGNRFLKGAATSGNGGATGGSSDSHSHTDSGHTHTESSHGHSGTTNGPSGNAKNIAGSGYSSSSHTHAVSCNTQTATEASGQAAVSTSDAQPPFIKVNIIQNGTGASSLPSNIIAMWDGTIASIPAGWVLCDGNNGCLNLNDKFVKGANANGESGVTTGGAATHDHTDSGHTHTINSHTHACTTSVDAGSQVNKTNKTGGFAAAYSHTHGSSNISGGGTTGSTVATISANSDNRPPYKEIVYIMYEGAAGTLSVDIVDSGGATVSAPEVAMDAISFSFTNQSSTGILGVSAERIRLNNDSGTAAWTLTIAATSGATAVWSDGGSNTYDFNDPTASAGDGGDADSVGGQLTVDPSGATVSAEGGCDTTGVSVGSSSAFSQGSTDSITIASADGTASTGCYWDITDIDLSQTLPAYQATATYTINLTLTAS